MRFIRKDGLRPSADWVGRATEAGRAVELIATRLDGATAEESEQILDDLHREINRHSNLWAEIKPQLEGLSYGKCWYCESREERSHLV